MDPRLRGDDHGWNSINRLHKQISRPRHAGRRGLCASGPPVWCRWGRRR